MMILHFVNKQKIPFLQFRIFTLLTITDSNALNFHRMHFSARKEDEKMRKKLCGGNHYDRSKKLFSLFTTYLFLPFQSVKI